MEENKMPLLSVSNVTKIYNDYKALDDVSFNIGAGITALVYNRWGIKVSRINNIIVVLSSVFLVICSHFVNR